MDSIIHHTEREKRKKWRKKQRGRRAGSVQVGEREWKRKWKQKGRRTEVQPGCACTGATPSSPSATVASWPPTARSGRGTPSSAVAHAAASAPHQPRRRLQASTARSGCGTPSSVVAHAAASAPPPTSLPPPLADASSLSLHAPVRGTRTGYADKVASCCGAGIVVWWWEARWRAQVVWGIGTGMGNWGIARRVVGPWELRNQLSWTIFYFDAGPP